MTQQQPYCYDICRKLYILIFVQYACIKKCHCYTFSMFTPRVVDVIIGAECSIQYRVFRLLSESQLTWDIFYKPKSLL